MKVRWFRVGSTACVVAAALSLASAGMAQTKPAEVADPDYVRFAQNFEKLVMAGDPVPIDNAIDLKTIVDAATAGVPASKDFRTGFEIGVARSSMGKTLADTTKQKATYRLIHVRITDGKTHALYRLLLPNGSLNYHDWNLKKSEDGTIRITDGYFANTGENLSETLRRMYIAAVSADDPGFKGHVSGADHDFLDHATDLQMMSDNSRNNRPNQTLAIYDRLPDSLKQQKVFFLIRIGALESAGPKRAAELQKAQQQYATLFAGDPSVDLVCMTADLNAKKFKEVYAALDRLETWTGGDPFLLSMRGHIMLMEGDKGAGEAAEKLARQAIVQEPRLLMPRLVLVEALGVEGKYEDAVVALRDYETRTNTKLDVGKIPLLGDFVGSDAYKKYRGQ